MNADTNRPRLEQDYATFDCLAHYVARHLEDAASDDHVARRRFGRLVGLLAEHAERFTDPPTR